MVYRKAVDTHKLLISRQFVRRGNLATAGGANTQFTEKRAQCKNLIESNSTDRASRHWLAPGNAGRTQAGEMQCSCWLVGCFLAFSYYCSVGDSAIVVGLSDGCRVSVRGWSRVCVCSCWVHPENCLYCSAICQLLTSTRGATLALASCVHPLSLPIFIPANSNSDLVCVYTEAIYFPYFPVVLTNWIGPKN
jgi:hypothetical protein